MTSQHIENCFFEIQRFLGAHHEFLLQYKFGGSFALRSTEIEISQNKLLFSFIGDKNFQTWRVKKHELKNEKLFLDLTRNFESENETVILIPRVSAAELSEAVEIARIEKAAKIAAIVKESDPRMKLTGVRLNKENGRVANVFFETASRKHLAVIADVSASLTPELLISTAVLQLARWQNRKKNPIEKLWIADEKKQAARLQKLRALLRESWKNKIEVFEISLAEEKQKIKAIAPFEIEDLWREKPGKIQALEIFELSCAAAEIIKTAPTKIDAVFSKQGETLRFHGLPFARVRRVAGEEKVWFGAEKEKTILSEHTQPHFFELLENLEKYRRFDSPNKQHLFYKYAPEAWLESLFRRDIKLLDANLILSPVYHQFRAEREKIDLLALRRDGRLIIIELKAAPDREMAFQAADYWRKIELQRRKGNLRKAKVFGDLEIADKPAICYLVAPTLAFHRDFKFLAQTICGDIEMHRFNLAENWRENLKVLGRQ